MDDLISRREAVEAIQSLYPDMPIIDVFGSRKRWREKNKQYIECEFVINILPSAKRSKGKWEEKTVFDEPPTDQCQSARCSACGLYHTTPYSYNFTHYKFCPHCGAEMEKTDG